MNILVTGSRGALGNALSPLMQSHYKDHKIFKTSRNSNDEFKCELTNAAEVKNLIKLVRPKLIFHLAASFSNDFEMAVKSNVIALDNICKALIDEKLQSRIIIFGSAAEYGVIEPAENPVSEKQILRPVSIYGISKVMQTELAKYYTRVSNLEIINARVFNLSIPGLSSRLFYGRAEQLIKDFKSGKINTLEFGNLNTSRDYIGIKAASKQIFDIADYGLSGETYNVGSGNPKKIRSILNSMINKSGIEAEKINEKKNITGNNQINIKIIYADISKINAIDKSIQKI
jgi:nucleoside-diphosphate-sugar epimerase